MKKILLLLFVLLLLPSVHALLYVNAQWENELDKTTINFGESISFGVYAQTTANNFNYVKALLLDLDYNIIHTYEAPTPSGTEYLDSFDVVKSLYKKAGEFQIGEFHVVFEAQDNTGETHFKFIDLTIINHPPKITSTAPTNAKQGVEYQYQVIAEDPDVNDVLTYSLYDTSNLSPFGMTIDSNGLIKWIPNNEQALLGTVDIGVKVDDENYAYDTQRIFINVENVNDAPELDSIGNKLVNENQLVTFEVTANDIDNDPLTYSNSELPEGAVFEDQTFSWTPTYEQGTKDGKEYEITFIVSDSELTDKETIIITVKDVNTPPELEEIGDKSVKENELLEFTVSATDAENDSLTYSTSELPEGATFKDQTFSWTPTYKQSGEYQVTFKVNDNEFEVKETITITVGDVNRQPKLDYIGTKLVKEDQLVTFTVTASDPDNDELTYSSSELPQGAVFEDQTFSWTPTYNQSGKYQITFTVSDSELTDSELVTITVRNEDRAPYITSKPVTIFVTDSKFTKIYKYDVNAIDPDVDELTYSLIKAPEEMKINKKTGLITWTPNRKQLGLNDVIVQVSDGIYADTQSFTINVILEKIKLSAREKIHIDTLQIINDILQPGDLMLTHIGFSNQDNYDMDGKITISIPELAIRKRVKFSLDSGEKVNKLIPLEIPEYAYGEYFVMITIYDGDISRTKYRFVNII